MHFSFFDYTFATINQKNIKKAFLSLFLAATILNANSQVTYGIKAGANLSTLTGDVEDVKSKIGFHAGVFADFALAESFSIHPELYFSSQGIKSDEEDGGAKLNLSYVNLPVLARYQIPSSGLFFQTGPQIGFLTTAKLKDDEESEDYKEFLKKTDFSWAFGTGYKLTSNLAADLRYNLGLSNINQDDEGKIKNGVFQLSLSYSFGNGSDK